MKLALPSSDAFWVMASAYRDAGNSVLTTIQTGTYTGLAVMPCVFLFFRSIELVIKAVLVHHGIPEKDITRKLGHRISDLLVRTEEFTSLERIGIEPQERQLLDTYSDGYANKLFEYSDSWWDYPHLEQLQGLAHRVCEAVRRYEQQSVR